MIILNNAVSHEPWKESRGPWSGKQNLRGRVVGGGWGGAGKKLGGRQGSPGVSGSAGVGRGRHPGHTLAFSSEAGGFHGGEAGAGVAREDEGGAVENGNIPKFWRG